jgi:hypothetical protein
VDSGRSKSRERASERGSMERIGEEEEEEEEEEEAHEVYIYNIK